MFGAGEAIFSGGGFGGEIGRIFLSSPNTGAGICLWSYNSCYMGLTPFSLVLARGR